jgi:bacterioferritin-associated ferredoxin
VRLVPDRDAGGGALVIVCLCKNVSDRALQDAVRRCGSIASVLRATGAGRDCGACSGALARIHDAARAAGVTPPWAPSASSSGAR